MSSETASSIEPVNALKLMWDLCSDPHTCEHCQRVIVEPPESLIQGGLKNPRFDAQFPHTKAEALQALSDGCPLFIWLIKSRPDNWKRMKRAPANTPFASMTFFPPDRVAIPGAGSDGLSPVAVADSPAARIFPNRLISRHVGSDDNFRVINEWLTECHHSHPECRLEQQSFRPRRLIDISLVEGRFLLRLCENLNAENLRWCCLSYCWGGDQPVKTTKATVSERLAGIPYDELPNTLQDAITVTHRLGLRYIWIDCLCIVQDDDQDKASEISRMPDIYKYSYLTVSASSAPTCYDGFLQDRDLKAELQPFALRYRNECQGEGHIILAAGYRPIDHPDPVNARAWTFQERLLSHRLLDFSATQIRWRCQTSKKHHGGCYLDFPDHFPSSNFINDAAMSSYDAERLAGTWAALVQEYSQRSLSFEQDKLLAFSAMAQEMSKSRKDRYLAGLWEDDLPQSLFWKPHLHPRQQRVYRAPSWSWASMDGTIVLPSPDRTKPLAVEVTECEVIPTFPDASYGAVTSGYLVLEGSMQLVQWLKHGCRHYWAFWDVRPQPTPILAAIKNWDESTKEGADTTWALKFAPGEGLLLAQAESPECFRRVGIFHYKPKEEGKDPFEEVERRRIKII